MPIATNLNNTLLLNINEILKSLGNNAFDKTRHDIYGTSISAKGSLCLAQVLGLKYIPSLLLPPLKAIVVDLDNTLYRGILGEDEVDNLKPNLVLQNKLVELKKDGFLICVVSKNNEDDVKEMFKKRKDFALGFDDFTTVRINWEAKSQNIISISNELNFSTDAMLFIDDNIAEITEIRGAIANINTILATDENTALRCLNLYPRLLKQFVTGED